MIEEGEGSCARVSTVHQGGVPESVQCRRESLIRSVAAAAAVAAAASEIAANISTKKLQSSC